MEAGEDSGGFSDQVSRSAVEVCDFLTGVLLSMAQIRNFAKLDSHLYFFFFFFFNCQITKEERSGGLKV